MVDGLGPHFLLTVSLTGGGGGGGQGLWIADFGQNWGGIMDL